MVRNTPNFTYVQELACPRCGAMLKKRYMLDQRGKNKRIRPQLRRPEEKGPWAKDDVLEDATERVGNYEHRKTGRVWVHTADLECSKCGVSLSAAQGVRKDFADDELPYDFWDAPYGEYVDEHPQESPAGMYDYDPADPYGVSELF